VVNEQPKNLVDLTKLALAGDDAVFALILAGFSGMIRKVCGRLPDADFDDGLQLCAIALWREVLPAWQRNGFDGALAPLAQTVFNHTVTSVFRARAATKRGARHKHQDIAAIDIPQESADPALIAEQTEDAKRLLDKILAHATPTAKGIIPMILEGKSYGEIEINLGLGDGTVKATLSTLRRRLQLDPYVRSIEQVGVSGKVVAVYASAREAERQTGIPSTNISRVVRGDGGQAGGYRWRYTRSWKENRIDLIAEAEGEAINRAFTSASKPRLRLCGYERL
jgi:DNA-directed RNA polymerase specialized sigma24 family protein